MLRSRTSFPLIVAFCLVSAPAFGKPVRYEIEFDGITDVNDFSQAFPSFRVEFLVDISEPFDSSTYQWFGGAISDLSVTQGEDVIFQADTGDLQWWNDELEIHAGDAERFLDNAFFLVEIEDILPDGSFSNQLQEFRIPGFGGSIAWTVSGSVTQVPEPSASRLAGLTSLTALLMRRRRAA